MARWNEDDRWMSPSDRDEQRRWRGERQGQEWRAQDWRSDERRDEWRGTEGRGGERGREWDDRGRERQAQGREWGRGDWEREMAPGYGGTYGGSRGGYESRGPWGGERGFERDPYAREPWREGRYEGRYEEQGPLERMGERMKEGFRKLTGRGPKGYKRSDERIREDVSERIARSWVNADEVEVQVESGVVTLSGFVESRSDKRKLEDVAEDVFGVEEVRNHVRIQRETRTQMAATQPAQTVGKPTTAQRTQPGTTQPPGQH